MKKYSIAVIMSMFLLTGLFAQNGTRLIGFDAVTSGRGGTSTGFFDNPSLMINNPAGLSFLTSSRFDISISVMAPKLSFRNAINNTSGKNNLFPLGCLSYVKKSSEKFTYGLGIFTQGGMGADFNLNHALYKNATGNYMQQPYHSKFAVMQGGGSAAYKLTNRLSVGVTADLVYGQVEFQMPMSMPPSMMKGVIDPQTGFTFGDMFSADPEAGGLGYSEVIASANLKSLSSFGFNGKIGLAFKPNEKFSAGINYTLPVNLTYKNGKAEMDMTYQMNDAFGRVVAGIMQQNPGTTLEEAQQEAMTMFSQLGIDLTKGATDNYSAEAKFGLPQSLSAGIFFSPSQKIRLALDAEWINWEKAFKQMDISLSGGTNPNINRMLGAEGSFGMAFPMYWKNTIVIRTGAEITASKKLILRGGYVYGSNPVPASTLFPVFPAIVKHHITAGGSVKLTKSFIINAAYEHAFKNTETAAVKSNVANEYNNSTSRLRNDIFHFSVSRLLK
ncbi:MAG: outer membrane protein transport protein [Sphingobacteriales bacterium]|nr:outer membrane protein transport protein [Sphingobacteriales bacterium]